MPFTLAGCTQPSAANYNPNATVWDRSCDYLFRVGENCLLFKDVTDVIDQSFTLSFSVEGNNWVFFHDFIPDFYFHTREKIFNVKNQEMFEHNSGDYGKYYEDAPKSFFIDVVFKAGEDAILETVNWISTVLDNRTDNEWDTLTHISVWNSQQHSGRIPLEKLFQDLQYDDTRRTNGQWSFNNFRNALLTRGSAFLQSIFKDFNVNQNQIGDNPWYEKDLLQDKYFVVRFEFDNSLNTNILIHDVKVQAIKSKR